MPLLFRLKHYILISCMKSNVDYIDVLTFLENLMNKVILKSLLPILKWGTVIVTTAVVVISIQVNADGYREDKGGSAQNGKLVALPIVASQSVSEAPAAGWSPANGFADLIERVSPAVVHVAISGRVKARSNRRGFNFPPGSPFEDFFKEYRDRLQPHQNERDEQKPRPLGIGSGFIISPDGYVVTNNHVIRGADEIVVTLTDGEEYSAELKGTDSKTDLALLKLKKAKDLPYIEFGDDEKSRVGDWVVAIGNPFGLGGSASTGIISARGRDIRAGPYDDYIQVDAAINRGNSGGPLFNMQGQVIGINTAIYSPNGGSVGIGFSIPSGMAKNVISQLRNSGVVERAWIGVQIQPLNDELAEGFGRDNDEGALVASVVPDKPADLAGVQAGDIILSFDGEKIEKMRDLPKVVAQSKVGDKFKMVIWRNGGTKKLTIKTDRFPEDETVASIGGLGNSTEPEGDDVFGASLAKLNDDYRQRFNIAKEAGGVLVLEVVRDGLAARNSIRRGDVITSVDNVRVTEPGDVSELVKAAKDKGRGKIVVLLQRDNSSRFISLDLSE